MPDRIMDVPQSERFAFSGATLVGISFLAAIPPVTVVLIRLAFPGGYQPVLEGLTLPIYAAFSVSIIFLVVFAALAWLHGRPILGSWSNAFGASDASNTIYGFIYIPFGVLFLVGTVVGVGMELAESGTGVLHGLVILSSISLGLALLLAGVASLAAYDEDSEEMFEVDSTPTEEADAVEITNR